MRVRVLADGVNAALAEQLPVHGDILHPETNCAEWAIVALDRPLLYQGDAAGLLCLRPRVRGKAVGDPPSVPVQVALCKGITVVEGKRVYKVGSLVGFGICEPEAPAEQGTAADGGSDPGSS